MVQEVVIYVITLIVLEVEWFPIVVRKEGVPESRYMEELLKHGNHIAYRVEVLHTTVPISPKVSLDQLLSAALLGLPYLRYYGLQIVS